MKHLFIDANVVIDFLANRAPFSQDAALLFEMAIQEKVVIYISAVSYNNIYYILRQISRHPATILKLKKLTSFVNILDVTQAVITNALNSTNADFEDAIQYYTALSNSKIEAIITRDLKGFKNSSIIVLTPEKVIKNMQL